MSKKNKSCCIRLVALDAPKVIIVNDLRMAVLRCVKLGLFEDIKRVFCVSGNYPTFTDEQKIDLIREMEYSLSKK